jgi:hypothetical protein
MNLSQITTPPTAQPKTSYVEQSINSNTQRQNVDAVVRLGNKMDSVAKIIAQSITYEKQNNEQLKSINKNIQTLTADQKKNAEEMKKILKGSNQATSVAQGVDKKDHFKKADPDAAQKKTLKSMESLLAQQLKWNKENASKKAMGLIGGLGKLLAIGGLFGYILFGKKEFLMDATKSFKALEASFRVAVGTLKGIGKLVSGLSKLGDIEKIAVSVSKGVSALGKTAKEAKSFAELSKIVKAGGSIAKTGLKMTNAAGYVLAGPAAVNAAKTALAAKSATPVGKLMAAGSRMVTGVGAKIASTAGGKAMANIGGKLAATAIGKSAVKMGGKAIAKRIPILGSIMAVGFAIKRLMDGDVVGALLELGSGGIALLDIIAFPLGTTLSLLMDVGIAARDVSRAAKPKAPNGKSISGGQSTPPTNINQAIGDNIPVSNISGIRPRPASENIKNQLIKGGKKKGIISSAMDYLKGGAQKVVEAGRRAGGTVGNVGRRLLNSAGNKLGFHMKDASVDVTGVKSPMWGNFLGMANEYQQIYGKSLSVNSAYRTHEWQKSHYDAEMAKNPNQKKYAKPGESMHEFGWAMDIGDSQGKVMRELTQSPNGDLAKKWKLDFPIANRASYPEPWHIEPLGFKSNHAAVQSGTYDAPSGPAEGDNVPLGDNVGGGKLKKRGKFAGSKSAPVYVKLDDESIDKLASVLAKQKQGSSSAPSANMKSGAPLNVRGR